MNTSAPEMISNLNGSVYGIFYDLFGGDEFWVYVGGGTLFTSIFFWLFNLPFIVLDFWEPKWAQKYKIQDTMKVNVSTYLAAFKTVLLNQLVVGPLCTAVWFYAAKYRGCGFGDPLPSWFEIMFDIAGCYLVELVGFYYTHRLFHEQTLYAAIHKKHHEFTSPISITCIYAHPIEHAVSNLGPVMLGTVVCGSHVLTLWIWATIAIFFTTFSHCGYHFPFTPDPEFHDYHHKHFNECFGIGPHLDSFHGTDTNFKKSIESKRSYMSFSLKPVKEIHPK